MHVQVLTYDRGMMGEQEYIDFAHEIAPRVATVPGLLAAVWFDGAETGSYGGLFFWDDHPSMERFTESPLFQDAFVEQFGDVFSTHADVLENVTRVTQPFLEIVPTAGAGEMQAAPALAEAASRPALGAKKKPAKRKASSAGTATRGTATRRTATTRTAAGRTAKKATSVRGLAGKPKPASRKSAVSPKRSTARGGGASRSRGGAKR